MPDLDFDDIYYYLKPTEGTVSDWDMLPEEMKATYEKLGIPEAERKFLAGVTSQYDSEVVYHRNREDLEAQGILFTGMDQALVDYPDLVRKYLGTVIPPGDNKFAALNSAVWSGGSFIYVPPGVHVDMPLQAYFRINSDNAGQFERTLIIADEGFAALGGGGAHRQAGRAHPLHDDPELVAERLQPGHQAGARRDRGDRRVDRRQPRIEAHDEVPRGGHDRPEGAR
jgi:Fe-S cluster assembly scaffold protein SufB